MLWCCQTSSSLVWVTFLHQLYVPKSPCRTWSFRFGASRAGRLLETSGKPILDFCRYQVLIFVFNTKLIYFCLKLRFSTYWVLIRKTISFKRFFLSCRNNLYIVHNIMRTSFLCCFLGCRVWALLASCNYGSITETSAGRVPGGWCTWCSAAEALLLPENASRPRGPHREAPQLCPTRKVDANSRALIFCK